jgi:uncharacterized protein with beta-barrel porin domain
MNLQRRFAINIRAVCLYGITMLAMVGCGSSGTDSGTGGSQAMGGNLVGVGGSMATGGSTATGGMVMAMGGMMMGMGGMNMDTGGAMVMHTGGMMVMHTGGMMMGMGGMIMDAGGMVMGTGGMVMGTGGMVMGTGGMVMGTGGTMGGTCHSAGTLQVTSSGMTAYVIDGASNPMLTLCRGSTYVFAVKAAGHPFYINKVKGVGTSNAYSNGVTGNGATTGDVTFVVPTDAPDMLYYICSLHAAMNGVIHVID